MIEFKRLTVLPKIWCTKDLAFHQCPLRRKLFHVPIAHGMKRNACVPLSKLYTFPLCVCVQSFSSHYMHGIHTTLVYTLHSSI